MNWRDDRGSVARDALAALAVILSVLWTWHDLTASPDRATEAAQRAAAATVARAVSAAPYIFNGDLGALPPPRGYTPGQPLTTAKRSPAPGGASWESPIARGPMDFVNATRVIPGLSFDGAVPSGVTGDVGSNHIIEMANGAEDVSFVMFDKEGNQIFPFPTPLKFLFAHHCAKRGVGGMVRYDESTGRWFLTKVMPEDQVLCVSVSQTGDPAAGGFFSYEFPLSFGQTSSYLTRGRLGVVPGALVYVSTDVWNNEKKITGILTDALVAGANATAQTFSAYLSALPSLLPTPPDQDGLARPRIIGNETITIPLVVLRDDEATGGSSSGDFLDIFDLDLSKTWGRSSFPSFNPTQEIAIPELDSVLCDDGSSVCVPQPGTNETRIDGYAGGPSRVSLRRYGDREVLALSFPTRTNVSTMGQTFITLDRTNASSTWNPAQLSVVTQPDGLFRFAGGAALGTQQHLSIAYLAGSNVTQPGLRTIVADVCPLCPPGKFSSAETTIVPGTGIQYTYSDWSISEVHADPTQRCTFWIFGQTLNPSGVWQSWMVETKVPEDACTPGIESDVCGNDVTESLEYCDGADDDLCPGRCQPDCTCPSTCGDDIREGLETCDGTDDDACPGACSAGAFAAVCACPDCGDGVCLGGENPSNCPDDCGCVPATCGIPFISTPTGSCSCAEDCVIRGDCCSDPCGPCGFCPTCGDGFLQYGEECDDGRQCTDGSDCTDDDSACVGIGDGTCLPRDGDCCSSVCGTEGLGAPCADDDNLCTVDFCGSAGVCEHDWAGPGTICEDDFNDCTSDVCDGIGLCLHAPSSGICGGDTCRPFGTCEAGGQCSAPLFTSCDDGNACTDDLCDPDVGCRNIPNTSRCDDGDYCNGVDSCVEGVCADHEGDPCASFGGLCNAIDARCDGSTPGRFAAATELFGGRVHFFNTTNDQLVHTENLLQAYNFSVDPGKVLDVAITPDQRTAVASSTSYTAWWFNLADSPPGKFSGLTHLRGASADLDFSPDGRYAATCAQDEEGRITLIDAKTHEVVDTHRVGSSCGAVSFCPDGRLAWVDTYRNTLHLYRLINGVLSDTGLLAFSPHPHNVLCAGNVIATLSHTHIGDNYVSTYTAAGLAPVDRRKIDVLCPQGLDVDPTRNLLFVRGSPGPTGVLLSFDYDADTGLIGPLLYSTTLPGSSDGSDEIGTDQMVQQITNNTVYAPAFGNVFSLDGATGLQTSSFVVQRDSPESRTVTDPSIGVAVSVALPSGFGDCCTEHEALGCEIDGCQSCVCAIDPTCCQSGWDADCAALADAAECGADCGCTRCMPGNCNGVGDIDAGDPVCDVLCLIGSPGPDADCGCPADCNCVGGLEAADPVCTVLRLIDDFSPDTCLPDYVAGDDGESNDAPAGSVHVRGGKVRTTHDGTRARTRLRLTGSATSEVAATGIALAAHRPIEKVRLARRLRRAGFELHAHQAEPNEIRLMIVPPVRAPIEAIGRGPILAVRVADPMGRLYLRSAEFGSTRGLPLASAR